MTNPMLVRSLTLVRDTRPNSSRAEAHQASVPSADPRLRTAQRSRLLFPPRPAFHEGGRPGAGGRPRLLRGLDGGGQRARWRAQIRRRLRRVLEARP